MRKHLGFLGFSAFLMSAVWSTSAFGQQSNEAVVVGSVADPSHSAVSSAVVTLTHLATGATTPVVTGERGEYRTPPLRIGEYAITVEATGFKRINQRGLVLEIGDVRQLDFVLEVGQISETVDVEAAAPLLQSADAAVGTVINNQQIEDLPLNGRDYLQLAALSSGTIPSTSAVGISVGGQNGYAVGFLLDGVDNNNQAIRYSYGNQKEVIKPSVDAIQEFKVATNGYSAEFGRSSSGVVSVSIKSGTNDIHGTAYEFLRNEALDAKNLFATYKSPYKRNDFGASAGAPILRNRLFVFGDFEVTRVRQSVTQVDTVPTIAERQGIFPGAIYDPATYNSATGTRQQFAGNQIPLSRMDPLALKVLSWYPLPQTGTATNNYVYASPQNQDLPRWDLRADEILSDRQNLFFRFSSQTQDAGPVSTLPPDSQVNYYTNANATEITSHGFAAGYNRIWSPSLISSIHVGWNSLLSVYSTPDKQNLNGVIGLPGVSLSYPGGLVSLPITGLTAVGGGGLGNIAGTQARQLSADLTWTKAAHTFKFGVQAYWLQTNFFSPQQSNGILSFNGQYTRNPATLTGGNALADFLLGDSSLGTLSNFETVVQRQPLTDFFVQDDWKVSRRLTLNVGLRYELNMPLVDRFNAIANFDLDTNPSSPRLIPAGSQGSDRSDRALQGIDYLQFAPRFGFAYSLPDEKTVVRGGYGIFYSNVTTPGGMQSLEINPPYHLQVQLATDPNSPTLVLRQGFPAGALSLANANSVLLVSDDRSGAWPVSQQWNFNLQRELPGGILVEVGYYGNNLNHAWRQFDGNPAPPKPGNTNANRIFQSTAVPGTPYTVTLADVIRIQKDGYSRYNALQAKAEKRYKNGLTFIAAYSYSKSIALGENQSGGVQIPYDWAADRAVSSQDMTHHFVGSAVYALPFGRGKVIGSHWTRVTDAVLGGWSVGPIVTVDSGIPVNLTVNGNPSNTGQGSVVGNNDRPNVTGDWHLSDPTVQEWFNTAAFQANAKYTFGNAGRNVLRAPGVINLDLSANKIFRLTERVSAQLRLESFNATNTPALGAPNAVVGSPQFGQIASAGTPRDNQVGLKILF
ncbi:MAG: carboxypeptidase regulatory-like domain-containing protein [Acidobacteriia bacterium]|nr:carboxypeptidase regulatory-like domain-containing protein [Terriglobia bacterium]